MVLGPFGLKTGIHFAQFCLESGVVFVGTMGVYERIYRFNSKWVRKKEKYANSKSLKNFFLLLSNLSNGDIISALRPSSLKTGVKNDIFWSEIGDLENRAAHPHQEFPRSTPTPPGTLNSRTVVELDKRVNFNFRVFFLFVFFFFYLYRYGWIKHCKGRNLNAYSEYNFRHCLIPGNWQEIRAFLTQGSQLM